jgi:hypothetical protein
MLPIEVQNHFRLLGIAIREVDRLLSGERVTGREVFSVDTVISEPYKNSSKREIACSSKAFWELYDSLEEAAADYSQIPQHERSGFRIVAIFLDEQSFIEAVSKGYLDEGIFSKRIEISPAYNCGFKGYDVATLEYQWISFLTNCGKDMQNYLHHSDLNLYGLIDSLAEATKLKTIADKEISVHAPFGVWGICTFSSV